MALLKSASAVALASWAELKAVTSEATWALALLTLSWALETAAEVAGWLAALTALEAASYADWALLFAVAALETTIDWELTALEAAVAALVSLVNLACAEVSAELAELAADLALFKLVVCGSAEFCDGAVGWVTGAALAFWVVTAPAVVIMAKATVVRSKSRFNLLLIIIIVLLSLINPYTHYIINETTRNGTKYSQNQSTDCHFLNPVCKIKSEK